MDEITLIDTSINTDNLGDEIIMDAVNDQIYKMFPEAYIHRVPSHDVLSRLSHGHLRHSRLCFIGGTNILGSPGWRLRFHDRLLLRRLICFGVTWGAPDTKKKFSRDLFLRRALAGPYLHSVRDTFTQGLLDQRGIRSLSTACPTMWGLTPEHCAAIPRTRARDVLVTLTAYKAKPEVDRRMLEILQKNYGRLFFFSQMIKDLEYAQSLGDFGLTPIGPSVRAFNAFLEGNEVDFIGSRLHGGIRSLQKGRRALIVGVDHRSLEISKDTGLPVLPRTEMDGLEPWIQGEASTEIRLPLAAIADWRAQFQRA